MMAGEHASIPMSPEIHAAFMRIAACLDLLNENLLQADRDHPDDNEVIESGIFQSHYSIGHLSYELELLYNQFGTTEDALLKDFAASDEDLHSAPMSDVTFTPVTEDPSLN